MLKLVPKAWYSWDFRIVKGEGDGAEEIALLDRHWFRERMSFILDGTPYAIRRTSVVHGTFVLERDGRVIAEASKTSAFRRAFEVRAGPERWVVRATSAFRREFELLRGGVRTGTVRPASWLRRTATAEFPETIPLPLQVFLASLALILWKRDSDAAASV